VIQSEQVQLAAIAIAGVWMLVGRRGGMNFEWAAGKSASNREKHGVSFEEAATAFGDPPSSTILDPDSSDDETRFVLIGRAASGRTVVIVHTDRGESTRLISARLASRGERRSHEQG